MKGSRPHPETKGTKQVRFLQQNYPQNLQARNGERAEVIRIPNGGHRKTVRVLGQCTKTTEALRPKEGNATVSPNRPEKMPEKHGESGDD